MNKKLISLIFMANFVFLCNAADKPHSITSFPKSLSAVCRDGLARLYDECGDQTTILNEALSAAKAENKRVLVVFGEEWCIWCHVFERYIQGEKKTHNYVWRLDGEKVQWLMNEKTDDKTTKEATLLNQYVAKNFVLANIEGEYTNGKQTVITTGVNKSLLYYYPFIFVLDADGKYVNHMRTIDGLEIRESGGEEYRGYNRSMLLNELKKLREQAE